MSINVKTPVVTLSYPRLTTPDEKGKFSAALVFSSEAQKSKEFKAMKQALIDVAKEKFGDKGTEMLRKKTLKQPFHTTEEAEAKGYPEGSVYINVRTKNKPRCVTRIKNKDGKPSSVPDDKIAETFYPGSQAKVSLSCFWYPAKDGGGQGITFGLNNLQFWADGERLDSRVNPEDEFDADDEGGADLSDLEGEDADEEDDIESILK